MAESHGKIEAATSELAGIEDAQEALSERLQTEHGGPDGTADGGGTASVVKLKDACKQLKGDVKDLNIRISLLSCALLRVRVTEQTERRQVEMGKYKTRAAKQGGKSSDNDDGNFDD